MNSSFRVFVLSWLVLIPGHGSGIIGRPTPVRAALLPVERPDLSKASLSVQKQVRDAYASFMVRTGDTSIPDAQRAVAYGEMGKLLMAAEFRDVAEPALSNAQTLAPYDPRWPYYLAHLYRLNGEPVKATASLERVLRLKADDVAALVWLGVEYLERDQPEAAEARFTQALQFGPESVAALAGLGRAALAKRNYARAAECLEQALSLDRRSSSLHYPLAMAYRGLGQMEQAEAHLRQRGTLEPGPPDPLMQELGGLLESAMAYQTRGIRALERGRAADATVLFRRAIELEPGNASLQQRLGTALYLTGDVSGAVERFEESLRLSPGFARAHYSLGVVLASSGRYQAAKNHFAAAVRYEPDNLEARRALANLR